MVVAAFLARFVFMFVFVLVVMFVIVNMLFTIIRLFFVIMTMVMRTIFMIMFWFPFVYWWFSFNLTSFNNNLNLMFMDGLIWSLFFMAMFLILITYKTINIFTNHFGAHIITLVMLFNRVLFSTRLSHKPMRVWPTSMQDKVHNNIDRKTSCSNNQHHQWRLHKLFIDDPLSGFIDEENGQKPDNKKIGKRPNKFHAMISKTHFLIRLPFGKTKKDKADNKTK